MRRVPISLLACLLSSAAFAAEKFSIDAAHSKVGFSVSLVGVSDVDGRFSDYDGTVTYDEADLTRSSVTLLIKTASISTADASRDKDLCAPTFFDAEKYPFIKFQSQAIEKQGDGYRMIGTLTIKDIRREVVLPLSWRQKKAPDIWKNTRIAFDSKLSLNRKDYNVIGPTFWNNAISNNVDIDLRITAEIPNFDLWTFQAPPGKESIGAVVYDAVEKEGLDAALRKYKELKEQRPDAYAFGAGQLNLVGYKLLQHGKNKEALAVFKLNAELFPQEFAIQDSLGDGYLANGDEKMAAESFKKSLELNPRNTSAIESLRHMTAG